MQLHGNVTTLMAILLPIVVGVSFSSQGHGGQTSLDAHINDASSLTDYTTIGNGMLCSNLRATVDQGEVSESLHALGGFNSWFADAGNDYSVQAHMRIGQRASMSETFHHPAGFASKVRF